MPRKKTIDPIDQILSFAETAETSTILIVIGLLNREVKKRQPAPVETPRPVTRRRRIKPAPPATTTTTASSAAPLEMPTPKPTRRRRRMRADSKPPVSEATPIVPLQTEVGEGETEAYTGN